MRIKYTFILKLPDCAQCRSHSFCWRGGERKKERERALEREREREREREGGRECWEGGMLLTLAQAVV